MPRIYDDCELDYFRSLEAERIEQSGPTCVYYSLNRGSHVDALYGEPTNDPLYGGASARGSSSVPAEAWNYYPPAGTDDVSFSVAFEYQEQDNRNPAVRPEGFEAEYDAQMSIARDAWECAIEGLPIDGRTPKEGDVAFVFGEWWDVVRANKGGNLLDTASHVGYRLELRKRTRYTPDRKVAR